jgi:hypothetical protein
VKKVLFILVICFLIVGTLQACPKCKKIEANSTCLGEPTQVKFESEWNPDDCDCPPNGNIRYKLQFDDGNGFKDVGPDEYEGSATGETEFVIEASKINKAGFWKVSISLEGFCDKTPPKEDFTGWGPDSTYASFDVIFVNLNIGTVADDDEVSTGGFLCLNDDDDNVNSQIDKEETGMVAGENDLIKLELKVDPLLGNGEVTLEALDGGAKVKVWKTFTKGAGNEVSLPATWTTSNMPTTLFLEGFNTSDSVRDVHLALSYKRDDVECLDDIKATIIGIDLGIATVQEEDEETKGGYLCLNDDDDDNSTKEDRLDPGPITNEDDLEEIFIEYGPSDLNGANLTLSAVQGDSKIKIWEDANKTTAVILPKTWVVGSDVPQKLFVEGFEVSGSERDVELKLEIKYESLTCEDKVKATVVGVDLDIDNVADDDEVIKGGFFCLNKDDDNKNKTKDKDESGNVAGENDLVELNLKSFPNSLTTGSIELEAIAGGANVKVWKTATKGAGNEIPLPATWAANSNTMPSTIYIEGIKTSSAIRDVELKLKYTKDSLSCGDTVKATVIEIEKVEVHPSDTNTHKIPANTGADHDDHFVCARDTGDIVIDAKILPSEAAEITDLMTWDAGGDTITSPAVGIDKTTAKLLSGTSKKTTVKLKVKSMDCWEGLVWVVFANVASVAKTDSIISTPASLNIGMGYNFTHTLTPSTIITDSDRPDLSAANTSAVPPAGGLNYAGGALTGGANKKWDSSRQVRQKFINPSLIPLASIPGGISFHTDFLSYPSLADGDGRPGGAGAIVAEDLAVSGNDDSGVGDETNNPYSGSIGKLLGEDKPNRIMLNSVGADGDTVEWRLHFSEFSRINLGTKWYRISNGYEWKVHYKMKKVAGKWENDNSLKATDNAGF